MGDYHIFLGHLNIYEYRGDYTITPIGDNIFQRMFGYSGDKDPAYDSRAFAFYVEELDEVWFAYVSSTSTSGSCDKVLRYNVGDKFWYSREFYDEITGYGFYASEASLIWSTLVGAWTAQAYAWNSRQTLANSATTHLCSNTTDRVYEYEYNSGLDNATPIAYTVETKDFAMADGEFRFDKIEMMIQGTSVLLEYSTDAGVSWNTMATITQAVQDKVQVSRQFVCHKVRFRWSVINVDFALRWFGFSYKNESLY